MLLEDGVGLLKGVGKRTEEILNKAGIYTLMDLILYFPREYEKITEAPVDVLVGEGKYLVKGTFKEASRPVRTRTGKTMITLKFDSPSGKIKVLYFNMPFMGKNFTLGESYNLYGNFKQSGSYLQVTNPKVLKDSEINIKEDGGGKILCRYSLKENLSENTLRKLINQVLDGISIKENMPQEILDEYSYPSLNESIKLIHNPDIEGFMIAYERLKFQELFSYSLKIKAARNLRDKEKKGIRFSMSPRLQEFKDSLPFELTKAQSRSIREILLDQKRDVAMNRLLQGDVGSGKTIVALTALFNIAENGYQGALMVPTEILARQHYEDGKKLLEPLGVTLALLTGSTKVKEKKEILEALKNGVIDVIVGTHSLIEDDVEFNKLGLVITDEQHRFGVNQRLKLISKNESVDVLVMSATPIPRTLAMYLYSDLDLSVIDELPKGRKEIKTFAFTKKSRMKAYEGVLNEVKKGRQAYIVCPLIEEKEGEKKSSVERLYKELSEGIFKGIRVDMVHGRMKAKEKNDIMEAFRRGESKILISTTVIEVGLNVPNATIMVVEDSQRFGLSQLHQLRGRVGRGSYESYCFLIADNPSEDTRRRLNIMVSTNDGFKVAKEDLKLRGTGSIFGTNQSGDSGLILADFIRDYNIFIEANKWANIVYMDKSGKYEELKDGILKRLEENLSYICLN